MGKLSDFWKIGNTIPTSSDLVVGGLGFDVSSNKVYSKNENNQIFAIGEQDLSNYVKKSGDTMTGNLTIEKSDNNSWIWFKTKYDNNTHSRGFVGYEGAPDETGSIKLRYYFFDPLDEDNENNDKYYGIVLRPQGIILGEGTYPLDNNGLKYKTFRVWHEGNDGYGSGLDADLLQGREIYSSTNTLAGATIPEIRQNNSVMEIGRYIDFHNDNLPDEDYHVRLDCRDYGILDVVYPPSGAKLKVGGHEVWHTANLKTTNTFTGVSGEAVLTNSVGLIDSSLLSINGLYPVDDFTPNSSQEYPDTTDQTSGAMWQVSGLPSEGYTITSGDLSGQTVYNSNWYIYLDDNPNWMISKQELVPHTHTISQIDNLQNELDQKAPINHDHNISDVTDLQNQLSQKAPIDHNHVSSDVTDLQDKLDQKANTNHDHNISDVIDLQDELDQKAPINHDHNISDITNLQNELNQKAPINHNHDISDITNLQNELDQKAPINHNHDISDITNLQDELDQKASINHDHDISDITNLQNELDDRFTKSAFIDESMGSSDANKPIKTDINGKLSMTFIDLNAFKHQGPFTPTSSQEYPDLTNHNPGDFWDITGLPEEGYTFTTGTLQDKTAKNGDLMIHGQQVDWWLKEGDSLDPNIYYYLDGRSAITGPFAGGQQQIKNIADGTDLTDGVTLQQLNQKANKNHDHDISDITNLQDELDQKANKSGDTFTGNINLENNVKIRSKNTDGDLKDLLFINESNESNIGASSLNTIIRGTEIELNSKVNVKDEFILNSKYFTWATDQPRYFRWRDSESAVNMARIVRDSSGNFLHQTYNSDGEMVGEIRIKQDGQVNTKKGPVIVSNTDVGASAFMVKNIVYMSQEEYDAISEYNSSTMYVIIESAPTPPPVQTIVFDIPGNFYWESPEGVELITVCMIGGGGSGSYNSYLYPAIISGIVGGGFAGAENTGEYVIEQGVIYDVQVGTGGSAVNEGFEGKKGHSTSIFTISADGGKGGKLFDEGYLGDGANVPPGCGGSNTTDGSMVEQHQEYFTLKAYGGQGSSFGNGGDGSVTEDTSGGNGGVGAGGGAALEPADYSGAGGRGELRLTFGGTSNERWQELERLKTDPDYYKSRCMSNMSDKELESLGVTHAG